MGVYLSIIVPLQTSHTYADVLVFSDRILNNNIPSIVITIAVVWILDMEIHVLWRMNTSRDPADLGLQ